MLRRVAAIVILLATPIAGAEPVDVRVRLTPATVGLECRDVKIVARADEMEDRRAEVHEGTATLRLDGDHVWQLRVEAAGCWAERRLWIAADGSEVTVLVYRKASVRGSLAVEKGEPPQALRGTLFRAGESTATAGEELACELDFPRWSCSVPAELRFDLRLESPGFAAVHFWDLNAGAADELQLGKQTLRAGASLAGWVQDASDSPLSDARLTLMPADLDGNRSSDAKRAATRQLVRTNKRGFFQFTGLEPGDYRLVSQSPGLSPATIEVTLRDRQPLTWPTPIRHAPLARLDVTIDPASGTGDKPWVVELADEASFYGRDPKPPLRLELKDGRWSIDRLPAAVYRLDVRTPSGSSLESREVDLSEGGPQSLHVTVSRILVRGVLLGGDDPLEADIDFHNSAGKSVTVSTSKEGRFEAAFPERGRWSPLVRYPRGRSGARIDANAIELPADGEVPELELRLPGGRIHGETVTLSGDPERAAVHVYRNGRLVGQQVSGEDGTFDVVGLAPGSYRVDAEGKKGATPRPASLEMEEGEDAELRLVLEPYSILSGVVLIPAGDPASGAMLQVSTDGGNSWQRTFADVQGRFTRHVPAGIADVRLIALTHSWPASLVRVAPDQFERIVIRLRPEGGVLRVTGTDRPFVSNPTAGATLRAFLYPEPFGRFGGGIFVEAGEWFVCDGPPVNEGCRKASITPGGETVIDFKDHEEGAP